MSANPAPAAHEPAERSSIVVAGAVLLATTVLTLAWAAGLTGDAPAPAPTAVIALVVTAGWPALAWLAAAAGYGIALAPPLGLAGPGRAATTIALGVAALLALDGLAGTLGGLGAAGAWALLVPGWTIGLVGLERWRRSARSAGGWTVPTLAVLAGLPVGVLLTAALSPPGWLWASEFGGYDVRSYHLELPRRWLEAGGRIAPGEDNVYGFLPSLVEAGYLHLMALVGRAHDGLLAGQLLHAAMAILAAVATGEAAVALARRAGMTALPAGHGAAAAVVVLGTPWVVVTGSLAYGEMAACLMLAAGGSLLARDELDPVGRAAACGLLAAAAAGAKLTAAGLVGLPLAIGVLLVTPRRRLRAAVVIGTLVGLAVLAPWLIRNALAAGNPVFPFAAGLLGDGHWTADQHARWALGHAGPDGLAPRLAEGWRELGRYGLGPSPVASEPWKPQWSVLPWLGLAGAIALATTGRRRMAAVLAGTALVQVVLWLALTHVKSRFMLPLVVPASIATVLGAVAAGESLGARATATVRPLVALAWIGLGAWALQPALLLRSERDGRASLWLGRPDVFSGAAFEGDAIADAARTFPHAFVNFGLPADARVLLVGDAAPLYYLGPVTSHTVWDRGPMSEAVAAHPDDPAAWIADLRERGFTHVVLDPAMLENWRAKGWADPNFDPDRLRAALEAHATAIARYDGGVTIYALLEGSPPAATGAGLQG